MFAEQIRKEFAEYAPWNALVTEEQKKLRLKLIYRYDWKRKCVVIVLFCGSYCTRFDGTSYSTFSILLLAGRHIYDLKLRIAHVHDLFKEGVVKAPYHNNRMFADGVINCLNFRK